MKCGGDSWGDGLGHQTQLKGSLELQKCQSKMQKRLHIIWVPTCSLTVAFGPESHGLPRAISESRGLSAFHSCSDGEWQARGAILREGKMGVRPECVPEQRRKDEWLRMGEQWLRGLA